VSTVSQEKSRFAMENDTLLNSTLQFDRFVLKTSRSMKVVIGCDHAGYDYKARVVEELRTLGHEVIDVGTNGTASVDYPDFGIAAGQAVASGQAERGIVICGTGIGISISANKVKGIRCALCHDHFTAQMTRLHNDANIVAFGSRVIGIEVALDIIRTFLSTPFEGGRHVNRLDKIRAFEDSQQ
jgi:RpiB/LacA/LacB family sugar-phosphate isomerase